MAIPFVPPALALAALGIALVGVSAKAHGRQVRLLRERIGVWKVDFRADNGGAVAAIWRADRLVFWPALVVLAASAVLAVANVASDLAAALLYPLAIAAALAGAFTLAGVVAWAKLARPGGEAAWRRRAQRGSVGWWLAVAALWALAGLEAAPLLGTGL